MSLNPALDDVSHCPRCARPAAVDYPRSLRCGQCGYEAYWNPKPVAAAIPVTDRGEVILLRRGFEPGKGLWTMPGGFVDLGETVEQAAVREAREELEIDVTLTGLVGVYSSPDDRVVLIVHSARTSDTPSPTPEATEIMVVEPELIPWGELAFRTTEQALRDWVARN